MRKNQKLVTSWIGIGALVIACAATLYVAAHASSGTFLDESDPDNARLLFEWRATAWFMKNGAVLNSVLATILLVISAGVQYVSESYTKLLPTIVLSLLCIVGAAGSVWLLIELDDPEKINTLRYYGRFVSGTTNEQVSTKLRDFIFPLIGWFGTFLVAVLGLGAWKKQGVVNQILRN